MYFYWQTNPMGRWGAALSPTRPDHKSADGSKKKIANVVELTGDDLALAFHQLKAKFPAPMPEPLHGPAVKAGQWNASDADFQDDLVASIAASPSMPEPSKRILIIGHGKHGKDTVAEMLRDHYGIRFMSSSRFAIDRAVWPLVKDTGVWKSADDLYNDRANHRDMLFHAIRAYNLVPGPSLAEQMFSEGYDCYVGMRSRDEFEKSRKDFRFVVWVDASRRCPPEPGTSMELRREDADLVIDNNYGLEGLKVEVELAVVRMGLAPTKAQQ